MTGGLHNRIAEKQEGKQNVEDGSEMYSPGKER
jgi:hypothetical protein